MGVQVPKRWSNADLETLVTLYGKVPVEDLASILGRSEASIYKQAHVLNLATIAPRVRFMRHYRKSPLSNEQIAKRLGVQPKEVRSWRQQLGKSSN